MYEVNLERYYNRFQDNPQFKDYKQILFRAGDSIQSSELNELQITLKNDVSAIAKRFIGNGDFISGGEISLTKELVDPVVGLYDWTFECTGGVFFIDGEFIEIPESTLIKNGVSIEDADFSIGVHITYSVILEGEDQSLLDPAVGSRNYGQPGAGRLRILGEWAFIDQVVEDGNNQFLGKWEIVDGELVTGEIPESEFNRRVTEIVAEYDIEANGNYVIDGLKPRFTIKDGFTGPFHFQISEGKANIGGYKFNKEYTSKFDLQELIDFETKLSEPNDFTVDGNYQTRHKPVRKVFRITGEKYKELTLTRGTPGGIDDIPQDFQPVARIVSISQGSTVYQEGTDYILDNDRINWGPSGNEPVSGTSYLVKLDYIETQTYPGFQGNNGLINENRDGIRLEGYNPNSVVYVDYDFVLSRQDVIVMDSSGSFKYIRGNAREFNPIVPRYDTTDYLGLAEVYLSGEKDPVVKFIGQRVFKMEDIEKLYDDIRSNEYNINKLALQVDLSDKGMGLKNSFVETFDDEDQRDPQYESVDGYIKAIGVNGVLTLNVNWEVKNTMVTNSQASVFPNGKKLLRLETTGAIIPPVKSQPHYTKVRKINEFMFIPAPRATIKVVPDIYRWVDREIYVNLVRDVEQRTWLSSWAWSWWGNFFARRTTRRTSTTSTSIERSREPSIIPQIELRLTSETNDFNSNEGVSVLWNGEEIVTTVADNTGRIDVTFNVPENQISGTKEISVKGLDSNVEGSTNFTATPMTATVTTITTRFWQWEWIRRGDPVAQSFSFDEDTVIDSVKVWFETAPTTDTIFQICELTAGLPDASKILAVVEVPVGNIVSGSPYTFELGDKITCVAGKSYAFIVGCDDSVGEVRVARLGERTLNTGIWLTSQADTVGVFFNSSNGMTWSPIQEEDMMFEIYSTTFENEREFVFNSVNVENMTDIMIFTEEEVREGTSLTYSVTLDNTNPLRVYEVDPSKQYRLGLTYTGPVTIKAKMVSNGKYSPALNPNAQLVVGTTDIVSTYTSKAFEFDPNDQKIIAYLDILKESGTSYSIQCQIKQGNVWDWVDMVVVDGKELGDGWREEKYELDLSSNVPDIDQEITRVRINLNSDSPSHKIFISDLRLNSLNQ